MAAERLEGAGSEDFARGINPMLLSLRRTFLVRLPQGHITHGGSG
jgi:hypothetical protein